MNRERELGIYRFKLMRKLYFEFIRVANSVFCYQQIGKINVYVQYLENFCFFSGEWLILE